MFTFVRKSVHIVFHEVVQVACADHHGAPHPPRLEHVHSCDNSKPVQAFLINKGVGVVHKNIEDLVAPYAIDVVSGDPHLVEPCDKVVGGWPCDDYSVENNKRAEFAGSIASDKGKSSKAFNSFLRYCNKDEDVMMIIGENVMTIHSVSWHLCE